MPGGWQGCPRRAVADPEDAVAGLIPIRLLKPYRSFRPGEAFEATASLARRLVALGVACPDPTAAAGRPPTSATGSAT